MKRVKQGLKLGKKFSISIVSVALLLPLSAGAQPRPSLDTCDGFVTYPEIGTRLSTLQEGAPDIVRAFTIGTSVEGREIWAALLSMEPDVESAEPEARVIGGIHGNECMSVSVVLALAEEIVSEYGIDLLSTRLIDEAQLLFIPLINPDGYSSERARRRNSNGVDLNRNLGFAWVGSGTGGGILPFSEPETRALRDVSREQSFVLGLSYHTQSNYVNGPWNYTPVHPSDEDLIQALGDAYAGDSGYSVVFGWDWYTITGDVNDWSLGTRGTLDWTIELRHDRLLEWEIHEPAVKRFLAALFTGIRGTVTDAVTGEPLAARVEVEPEGAPVFTDPRVGDFHRVLLAGTYSLTFYSPGYEPQTVPSILVPHGDAVEVDVVLHRTPSLTPTFGFAVNQMTLPQVIANEVYFWEEYRNRTLVWSALGPEDGRFYSMSPSGTITIDLGELTPVVDRPGSDLLIVSGTESDDMVDVSVSLNQDGPFTFIHSDEGTFEVDLGDASVEEARYVMLYDRSGGPFNDDAAGYDLDAVINLNPPVLSDGDADGDTDGDSDNDADTDEYPDGDINADADIDTVDESDSDSDHEEFDRGKSGCRCGFAGGRHALLSQLLTLCIGAK